MYYAVHRTCGRMVAPQVRQAPYTNHGASLCGTRDQTRRCRLSRALWFVNQPRTSIAMHVPRTRTLPGWRGLKGAVAAFTASDNCRAMARATRRLVTSPATMPPTPPSSLLKAVETTLTDQRDNGRGNLCASQLLCHPRTRGECPALNPRSQMLVRHA